ncbi:PREDICTED: cytochrome P450 4F5-like [Trachymyrmex septentrionalis]|uniref:cytochrome P450 4F5-like n=1 Tax=Trachymyrmex septentrionalis TaxID=34720 RepID=UPI00084F714B|nr:PREDICTED: cytochrome P450 4F5-like [Trachymyrmex septentrionalis]
MNANERNASVLEFEAEENPIRTVITTKMFISIFLLLIPIVYLIYHYYVQYGSIGRLINNIPGPPGYPIIGNTLLLLVSREDLWKLLKILSAKYSVWKMWSFFEYVVSIRHPDDLEKRSTLSKDSEAKSYLLPPKTMLYVNIYGVHRDPNFWPNPEIFDPDRFLPEKIRNRHPYSYLPFSAGPRNCIGQRFAMLEMKELIW